MAEQPIDAARLLSAVQQWTRQTFPAPAGGVAGTTCAWCPLCQFMAVLRGERPEITERIAEAGAAIVSAVQDVVGDGERRPRPTPRRVQHIDLEPS